MQISSNMPNVGINIGNNKETKEIKTNFTEKLSADDVKDIKSQMEENARSVIAKSIFAQTELSGFVDDAQKSQQAYEDFQNFLKDIGYDGKPIAELSQDEAKELVSDDGFFGVSQTSQRVAEFVINGADGDEELLRAGREGIIQGYKDAEEAWGSELPDIAKETQQKSLELIDKKMQELGFSILNEEV